MTAHSPAELADLAEVIPPSPGSHGEGFLLRVAEDVAERLEQLSVRFHADEIPSIADSSLDMPDPALWPVWLDLSLWEEDVTHLVPASADMEWRAETAIREVGLRLAAALVAQALMAESDGLPA